MTACVTPRLMASTALLTLGTMPALMLPSRDPLLALARGEAPHHPSRDQDAGHIADEDQLERAHRSRDRRSHMISVDIIAEAVECADADGTDNRHNAGIQQRGQQPGVYVLHLAHTGPDRPADATSFPQGLCRHPRR